MINDDNNYILQFVVINIYKKKLTDYDLNFQFNQQNPGKINVKHDRLVGHFLRWMWASKPTIFSKLNKLGLMYGVGSMTFFSRLAHILIQGKLEGHHFGLVEAFLHFEWIKCVLLLWQEMMVAYEFYDGMWIQSMILIMMLRDIFTFDIMRIQSKLHHPIWSKSWIFWINVCMDTYKNDKISHQILFDVCNR